MKRFFAAVRFFTVIPVPASWCGGEREFLECFPYLPWLGLALGLGAAWLGQVLAQAFPPLVTAVMLVIALGGISGFLHLDGLADTADGFLSARPRERTLEIMKDSHIGAMGVLALLALFSLKIAALASTPLALRWRTLLLMPLAGRCANLGMAMVLPPARPDGLGRMFSQAVGWPHALAALTLLVGVAWAAAGPAGLVVVAGCLTVWAAFCGWCHQKIGGMTGDTLGACAEIIEAVAAVILTSGALA